MATFYLTQYNGKIIGPVAKLLGYLMNGLYWVLDKLHIGNIGLAIILFTIAIYLLLLPLTIKQQKFSKFSAKMNPELTAIREKYKGKQDQASVMAMQQETKAVYAKYGVSASGSCVQLLIQMPILFALYRVIYAVPAYVGLVKDQFTSAVTAIVNSGETGLEALRSLSSAKFFTEVSKEGFATNFLADNASTNVDVTNKVVDLLNRASTQDWEDLKAALPDVASQINDSQVVVDKLNHFGALNIANTPWDTMQASFASGKILIVVAALMIPILAALTQFINVKLMPNAADNSKQSAEDNPMAASMKSMNTIMPLMSAFISFTLPIGMGIYWIAGAVVRTIQQIIINKSIDKIDIEAMIEKNVEKYNEKAKKYGMAPAAPSTLSSKANLSTKNVSYDYSKRKTQEEREADRAKASEYYQKKSENMGSLTAKANMVKQFEDRKKNS